MHSFKIQLFLNYRDYLKQLFPQLISYLLNGEFFIKVPFNKLPRFLYFLKNHTQSQFKILSDISAIDYPWISNRFQIFYNVLSIAYNARLTISIHFPEQCSIHSISHIYSIAGWFEREIWDLFGISFVKNFDLRRIVTDYGFKGHPLRKDFPLTGYIEVLYSFNQKRIVVRETSLSQEYRIFYFNNSWNRQI